MVIISLLFKYVSKNHYISCTLNRRISWCVIKLLGNYSITLECHTYYSNYSQILNIISGKVLKQTLEPQVNCEFLTFVAPRLIVVTEADAATVIFSEESAWCSMLQSNVTEDMIIWRIERIPLRASYKCLWSTLTQSY